MRFLKRNISQIITVVFFAALAWYFVNNKEALQQLLSVTWWVVVLLILLRATRIFVTGLFTKITLAAFGKRMTVKETNYLSLLSSLGNFFGPILGGASVRAVYLKQKYNFEYSKFISTLYGFYVISFLAVAFVGLVSLVYIVSVQGVVPGMGTITFALAAIFVGNLLLILLPPKWLRGIIGRITLLPKRLVNILYLMSDGWETMRSNKNLLARLAVLNLVVFGIVIVESALLYSQFTNGFTPESVILYAALGALSTLVSFTPGAIGIKEGIYLFSGGIIALSSTQIVQIAAIDRSATFLLLFVAFLIIKAFALDGRITDKNRS